ncbi:GNAT family N-acetyltransferase [soil metagenome]
MEIMIRKVMSVDHDRLFVLVTQFATSFQPQRAAFAQAAQHLLRDESAWWAVAECAGTVVGYCLGFVHYTFYANGRVAWVEEIMVEPRARQQGVGRALMVAFEQWAVEHDAKLVALATRRATPFYQAIGYEASATYFRKVIG